MARLSTGDLHVDAMLTNISIGYTNPDYIADKIFPIVPVVKQSGIVPRYDQSHWFRDGAEKRGGGKSPRGGFSVDKSMAYLSERFWYGFEVDDETRDNSDSPFDIDRDATQFATDKVQMKREISFATDFMAASVWGTDKAGGSDFTQWSDYGASSPLTDLTDFGDTVEGKIGREPKKLVIGKLVYSKLKWHPDLIDMIKYTQRGQITPELLASLLELEDLLIGRAIKTADPEGTAEASVTYSRIWGKKGLLIYVPKAASLMTPAAGYTFVWQRVANAIQYIKRMRDEEREVDIIEANTYFDQKVTGANGGLFMDSVIA